MPHFLQKVLDLIFIGKEEEQLTEAFGKEYEDYTARVDRLVPFKKP
jgi:protein-S-isoprenylcysteine O-methyltransferase Ste14